MPQVIFRDWLRLVFYVFVLYSKAVPGLASWQDMYEVNCKTRACRFLPATWTDGFNAGKWKFICIQLLYKVNTPPWIDQMDKILNTGGRNEFILGWGAETRAAPPPYWDVGQAGGTMCPGWPGNTSGWARWAERCDLWEGSLGVSAQTSVPVTQHWISRKKLKNGTWVNTKWSF